MTAAGTVLFLAGMISVALLVAGRQLERMTDEREPLLGTSLPLGLEFGLGAGCDHDVLVDAGEVLLNTSIDGELVEAWVPVDRCVDCGADFIAELT